MINLAYRDIAHGFGRYLATGLGLGLLIGVTLTMAGVYRGMVEDGLALLQAADADVWVVQQHTLGPFAEPSSLSDEMIRGVLAMPGVRDAGNVAYLTMEVIQGERSVRVMMAGYEPGRPGGPDRLIEGRFITRNHYEMVADVRTGFRIGDRVPIRRHDYTVVGITKGLLLLCHIMSCVRGAMWLSLTHCFIKVFYDDLAKFPLPPWKRPFSGSQITSTLILSHFRNFCHLAPAASVAHSTAISVDYSRHLVGACYA